MNAIINLLKAIYYRNKLFFVIALIAILVFLVGCTTQGGPPSAPSGPIGGGCG